MKAGLYICVCVRERGREMEHTKSSASHGDILHLSPHTQPFSKKSSDNHTEEVDKPPQKTDREAIVKRTKYEMNNIQCHSEV